MRELWTKKINFKIGLFILAFLCVFFLTACGESNPLVGTWLSDSGDMVVFEEDGTCSAPFTYNASWIESADHYTITEEETLVFSSEGGHANHSYDKADSEEYALEKSNTYYVSGNKLIIERKTYTKS